MRILPVLALLALLCTSAVYGQTARQVIMNAVTVDPACTFASVVDIDRVTENWAAATLVCNNATGLPKNESIVVMRQDLLNGTWRVYQIIPSPYANVSGFGTTLRMMNNTLMASALAPNGTVEVYNVSDYYGTWQHVQTLTRVSPGYSGYSGYLEMSTNGVMAVTTPHDGIQSLYLDIYQQNPATLA